MQKRILSFVIALILLISLSVPVFAQARADSVHPSITFSGSTVNCSVTISGINKNINANLELWCDGRMVDSWSKSGQHALIITGSHYGISGREYVVTVTGTIGNDAIVCYPVSGICP